MKSKIAILAVLFLSALVAIACSDNSDAEESTQTVGREAASGDGVFDDTSAFRVRLNYPNHWEPDPDYYLRFSGPDGFVSINAQESEGGIDGAADAIAHHKLAPYGVDPQVEVITLGGADGRVIRPSEDQHPDLRGQVALVLERTPPLTVDGETYSYLVIEADGDHFERIVKSVELLD
jgi:TolB protein